MSGKDFDKYVDSEQKKNAKHGGISDTVKNTIIGGIITLVGIIITYIVAPNINNIIQAQQTQSAIALTQNAPIATTITAISTSTDVPSPSAIPTETTAPVDTGTPSPTAISTDTQQPMLTEAVQPSATIDLVAKQAATIAVQRTGTWESLIAQQTADAIFAAEDSTATANAIASFTKTLTPTATFTLTPSLTLRPIETIQPTNIPERKYPCEATVSTAYGDLLPYFQSAAGGSSNGSVRKGQPIKIIEKSKNPNKPMYLIADTSGRRLGYIDSMYVDPSNSCPS